jgi:uncharacterized protein YndB with AHSA1/START domain
MKGAVNDMAKDTAQHETSITVTRTIPAPPEAVFAAWTDPKLIERWLASRARIDARPGGRFRLESGQEHSSGGEYWEFAPGRRLVQTWIYEGPISPAGRAETLLTVDFREAKPGSTEITLKHDQLTDSGYREVILKGAWNEALDKLEKLYR